jgi:hypothetical protein
MSTAIERKLTKATKDSFIMRADSRTVLDPEGPGRDSIRAESKKQWTNGITVLNLAGFCISLQLLGSALNY